MVMGTIHSQCSIFRGDEPQFYYLLRNTNFDHENKLA